MSSSPPPGGREPPPEPPELPSPWQRAKAVAESQNIQAIMEDMERRYYEVRRDRDAMEEQVKKLEAEKEASKADQAALTAVQQEKTHLQSQIQQQEMKSKGLEEEKTLLQERMDRMQVEADQLRAELR